MHGFIIEFTASINDLIAVGSLTKTLFIKMSCFCYLEFSQLVYYQQCKYKMSGVINPLEFKKHTPQVAHKYCPISKSEYWATPNNPPLNNIPEYYFLTLGNVL